MSQQDTGGAAFPNIAFKADENGLVYGIAHRGMDLRDYFAAKAMHAELNTAGILPEPRDALIAAAENAGRTIEQQIAFNAYELADAMIKARTYTKDISNG